MGGEGSGRGGGEGRGKRFSVWSCSRSARAVSPGWGRPETFQKKRTPAPRTPSLDHTHAQAQPGRAGATEQPESSGTGCGQRTEPRSHWGYRRGDLSEPPGWARTPQDRGEGPAIRLAEPIHATRAGLGRECSKEERLQRAGLELPWFQRRRDTRVEILMEGSLTSFAWENHQEQLRFGSSEHRRGGP